MKNRGYLIILTFLIFSFQKGISQENTIRIEGCVSDSNKTELYLANIIIVDTDRGTYTDNKGCFSLIFPKDNATHTMRISSIGYDTIDYVFKADSDKLSLIFQLNENITAINEVRVRERGITESPTLTRLPLRLNSLVPSATNSIESLLKTMPGVNSQNELSAQYTVRGGSYDENLVYINVIEMYKPHLIKSGRKEGLSIINPDLTGSIYFSSGGYNATYGDKLSSVLDITYKEPEEFKGSVNLSLLTSSLHLEGKSDNNKFSIITGARYMTNRYLLRSLDTRANYTPYFNDIQSLISVSTGSKSKLSLFTTYGVNNYEFTPVSRRSSFGTYQEAYQLYVDYEGFEKDRYSIFNGALIWDWNNKKGLESKLTASYYSSVESESYDIRARYSLNLLDKDIGSENIGDSIMNIGVGSWLDHARNLMHARVFSLGSSSTWKHNDNIISWGIKVRNEKVDDYLNEWKMIDSAGYSLPYSDSQLELYNRIYTEKAISSERFEIFFSDNYTFDLATTSYILTIGARATYWSLNRELNISPRFSIEASTNNLSVYFASGIYYQPPFYREMRLSDGSLNYDIRSQKSTHYVLGSLWFFRLGQTSFRLMTEAYYKKLDNLIPYKFDNVRVIYSGENSARGNISGIDIRLNGEFVKDAESWLSLSLMKATHDISNDDYGSFPAPGDIRFAADLFFQDYFPSNPSFRAHIKLHYSSGMPVNSPYEDRYDNYFRMPSYKRVDIGFTKNMKDRLSAANPRNPLSHIDDLILGIEIFNLLDIKNTISYNWLSTINNLSGEERQFAVPNYLTGRSLNLKLSVKF
jgi:hypothetical protein